MLRLKGRLDKLERTLAPAQGPRDRIRLVLRGMTKAADLRTSTCTRTLGNGMLTEVVVLDGSRDGLSDEQLERFIESFPIHEAGAC